MNDDDKLLTDSDQDQLEAGDDTPQLKSGDDLVADALGQSGNAATTNPPTNDDEVAESDQIAETIASLQHIIERNANNLDKIKAKIKLQREQLRSVFENDTQLSEVTQQVDTFNQQVKQRKSQLQADPTVTRLKIGIGELNEQKKEIEEALSNHLVNYYQLTNSTSFDTSDGDQREFSIRAAVKSKRK